MVVGKEAMLTSTPASMLVKQSVVEHVGQCRVAGEEGSCDETTSVVRVPSLKVGSSLKWIYLVHGQLVPLLLSISLV